MFLSIFLNIKCRFTLLLYAIILFIFSVSTTGFSKNDSFIGIRKFIIDPNASEYYNSIDILLFQRLSFELLPRGIRPLLIENETLSADCVAIVSASIDIIDDKPILYLTISGASHSEEETKKIHLENQSVDAIIDIMAIKIRHFLEQTVSGKLRIASQPLDCDILLDGVKIGKTPAELLLEQGHYNIQLQKEYLFTHYDSVTILPGRETTLSVSLKFKGHSLKPWITSAFFFTGCTIISRIIESQLHKEYNRVVQKYDSEHILINGREFDQKYQHYRIANSITIGLLIPTTTTWTIAGYHFWGNKSLKKRIFVTQ